MFANEKAVWKYLRPRLAREGWWWQRVEAAMPAGVPDVLGMGPRRRTVWIELKEGKPLLSAVRVDQRTWLAQAWAAGAEAYLCFGTDAGLVWFQGLDFSKKVEPPDIFRLH
jgi:hypothetical protein